MATIIIITPPPKRPKSAKAVERDSHTVVEVEATEGMTDAEILRAAADQLESE